MSQITLNAAQAAKAKEKGNRLFKDGDLAEYVPLKVIYTDSFLIWIFFFVAQSRESL